jgi:hypothetical protein
MEGSETLKLPKFDPKRTKTIGLRYNQRMEFVKDFNGNIYSEETNGKITLIKKASPKKLEYCLLCREILSPKEQENCAACETKIKKWIKGEE